LEEKQNRLELHYESSIEETWFKTFLNVNYTFEHSRR
jgi:hypothetical protein